MTLSDLHRHVLAWRYVPGFGLKGFAALYRYFGSLSDMMAANAQALERAGLRRELAARVHRTRADALTSDQEASVCDWLPASHTHHLVHIDEPAFPALLREIHCPPPLLYLAGNPDALQRPGIAVIGARKASALACSNAYTLAADLAKAGYNVVSGLAIGIDAQAHEGALSVDGCSVAVLACGLDRCYPKRHAELASRLQHKGAVISEMPPGTAPHPGLFPRRNRLVSGLCRGVVVVEAGLKSGSLITAAMALEQNRELMAMPGQVGHPQAKGCHFLIKQGAALIEDAQDVMDVLGPATGEGANAPVLSEAAIDYGSLSEQELRIVAELAGVASMDFDLLSEHCGLPVSELNARLLGLQVKGVVATVPGGYQLAKPVNLPA